MSAPPLSLVCSPPCLPANVSLHLLITFALMVSKHLTIGSRCAMLWLQKVFLSGNFLFHFNWSICLFAKNLCKTMYPLPIQVLFILHGALFNLWNEWVHSFIHWSPCIWYPFGWCSLSAAEEREALNTLASIQLKLKRTNLGRWEG